MAVSHAAATGSSCQSSFATTVVPLELWSSSVGSAKTLLSPASLSDGPRARTLVPGVAEGDLVGGTLSLLPTVLGTPFEIDTRGCILLLEDVNEEPPRIERYLTHLLNAGKLHDCAGICLGNFLSCEPREHRPRWDGYNPTVEELVEELIVPLGVPTIAGVRLGHGPEVVTVPLGVHARLDADSGRLEILEGALAE